jgi:glucosyl-dolichyl phosphate glucuronosyltransferase
VKLDVVVPTYNRSDLLQLTIASLLEAPIPPGLEVTILIVDNNSKDNTAEVVRKIQSETTRSLVYVKETKQGLSHARNGGIAAGTGDLIGFIDDDEEIDAQWYTVIAREFSDPAVQFIGGPYLANCQTEMPSWLPPGYNGVIGVIEPKPRAIMNESFPGNLQGGNAVFRRTVFDQVGAFDVRLGRSGKGLLSEEDAELYRRLISANILGYHVPDLIIYHYIPASRLTRSYYRSWCYWRGVSHGIADKKKREPAAYIFGLPRHRIRKAAEGLAAMPQNLSKTRGQGPPFTRELAFWDLLGFIRGKFFINIDKYYADKK